MNLGFNRRVGVLGQYNLQSLLLQAGHETITNVVARGPAALLKVRIGIAHRDSGQPQNSFFKSLSHVQCFYRLVHAETIEKGPTLDRPFRKLRVGYFQKRVFNLSENHSRPSAQQKSQRRKNIPLRRRQRWTPSVILRHTGQRLFGRSILIGRKPFWKEPEPALNSGWCLR